jgi:hypothetical protein
VPAVARDDDLPDVALARGQRVDAQEEVAGPSALPARRELARREEREQDEETDRQTDAVGAREDANEDPERREEDRKQRSDDKAGCHRVAHDSDAPPEEPDVRERDGERAEPQRERRQELARRELEPPDGGEEQALERPAFSLPAPCVGGREEREQASDRDRHLEGEVHGLALLEEVERPVRRDEVRDHAQEQAEREAQGEPAAAEPEVS